MIAFSQKLVKVPTHEGGFPYAIELRGLVTPRAVEEAVARYCDTDTLERVVNMNGTGDIRALIGNDLLYEHLCQFVTHATTPELSHGIPYSIPQELELHHSIGLECPYCLRTDTSIKTKFAMTYIGDPSHLRIC